MTFRVIEFEAWHLSEFEASEPGIKLQDWWTGGYKVLETPASYTILDDRILACGGIVEIWQGRDFAWMAISRCGPAHFLKIHRAVTRVLNARGTKRTEMWVDTNYPEGHRWARLLGFRNETEQTHMQSFMPNGAAYDLYARIL